MHTSMAGVEHEYRRIPGLMDELRARTISGTVIATTVVCALLLCPAVVRAENIVIPFLGRSFGESDLVKVTTLGASLASMSGGIGFEVDFARTSLAMGSTAFVDNSRVTMIAGNALVGLPFGRFRPYAVGGVGWLRTQLQNRDETVQSSGLGIAGGAGFIGFFGDRVGVRIDLRYVRSVTDSELEGTLRLPTGLGLTDFLLEELSFWRASAGIAFRL